MTDLIILDAIGGLLDGDVAVWRPCEILPVDDGKAVLLISNYDFCSNDETWEILPGSICNYEIEKDGTCKISPAAS